MLPSGARSGKPGGLGGAEGLSSLKRDQDHTRSLGGAPWKEMESQKTGKAGVKSDALATHTRGVHRLGEPERCRKRSLRVQGPEFYSAFAPPSTWSLGKLLNTEPLACQ